MVRILEKIFGLHAVARKLCIARHAFVFFEQLSGVAALAVILAIAWLSADIRPSLAPAAATAATLTIVDQMPTSLRSVSYPLRLRQAGLRKAPALTLSFRSQRQARSERPIVSGLGQDALSSVRRGAGPAQSPDVVSPTLYAKRFRSNAG